MTGLDRDTILRKIAPSDGTVLLLGETGTGKTHLAREIHRASQRKCGPFVCVNLGTLNENLIESELFGHEKGSFSGAVQRRIGKLESAQGGTIFLDEIGELSLSMQTRLLDAIYSKSISPVGSNRKIHLNVRVITATNRDLEGLVANGEFREDLYFRINTFFTKLPNIRENRSDLANWIQIFLSAKADEDNREYSLTNEAKELMLDYTWPGNLRELKNCIEFATTLAETNEISTADLPIYMTVESASQFSKLTSDFPLLFHQAKAQFEENYLLAMLQKFSGKINQTARATQMSKVTLIEKIRRYNIDIEQIKFEQYQNRRMNQSGSGLTSC